MKKSIKKIGSFALLALVLFSSCKKDEETETPVEVTKHYVQINDTKIKMDYMFDLYRDDYVSNDYMHRYLLVEKTVSYNTYMSSLMGNGDGFDFVIKSTNNSFLPDGEYVLNPSSPSPGSGVIEKATFYSEYDFFMEGGEQFVMKSGSCTITGTGAVGAYKIEGTFIGNDNKEYKIFFDGTVEKHYFDY